jgi:DNA-binding NtrC family response regulator
MSQRRLLEQKPNGNAIILLAEDDEGFRRIVRNGLRRLGHTVIDAADGNAALAAWATHNKEVSALVTDMLMPGGIDGLDLARKLREDRPELCVLLMSGDILEVAFSDPSVLERERLSFITKPFNIRTLNEEIRVALENGRRTMDVESP